MARKDDLDAIAARHGYSSYYAYRNAKAQATGFRGYSEQRAGRRAARTIAGEGGANRRHAIQMRDKLALSMARIAEETGQRLEDISENYGAIVELIETGNTGLTSEELYNTVAEMLGLEGKEMEGLVWEWIREHYGRKK